MADAPSSPLRSPDPPGRGYTCVGVRLLEEWAQNEPRGVTEASQRIADACGVTRPAVASWRTRARPAPRHWETIERLTGVMAASWESWELLGREEPEHASEERPVVDEPLGTTPEELRASARRCKALAKKAGLSPTQQAQLEGKTITALNALARLEERQAIADHPDFPGLLEDIVAAVIAELGPDAPEGLEARIADRFEVLQAKRASEPERRAA